MEKERDEYLDNEAYQRDPNRMTLGWAKTF